MKEFWNERYSAKNYAYGTEPNIFFREQILKLRPGKILLPAEGEGRNAVFAAVNKWEVIACDISEAGRTKAMNLAEKNAVSIQYEVGDFGELEFSKESFDAVGLIFAHFPTNLKTAFHKRVKDFLKPGGIVILEAFNKEHLNYNLQNPKAGGPKEEAMLYSLDELKNDFGDFEMLLLEDTVMDFDEGEFHLGLGSVSRMLARKAK